MLLRFELGVTGRKLLVFAAMHVRPACKAFLTAGKVSRKGGITQEKTLIHQLQALHNIGVSMITYTILGVLITTIV